jgi:isoleucyl-tRNA synthetase
VLALRLGLLDEWILSELHTLIAEVTEHMDAYNLTKATRPLMVFVDNLSNWYVRRSRRRFWKSENDTDKAAAYETLYAVLTNLCLLIAPFMPFTAEAMYKNLTGKFSVHDEDWPTANSKFVKRGLNEEIKTVRTIVSLALRIRAKKNLKVRQPLGTLMLALPQRIPQKLVLNYRDVILEELNVKELKFEMEGKIAIQTLIPDARKIGPRFGKETQKIIDLAKKGDFRMKEDGSVALPANRLSHSEATSLPPRRDVGATLGKGNYTLQTEEFELGYRGSSSFDVESANGILVGLDTTITKELKEEGCVRDLVRKIQELRKKANYGISDRIYVYVAGPKPLEEAVTRFADFMKRETLAIELQEGGDFEWDAEEEMEIDGMKVKVGVRR